MTILVAGRNAEIEELNNTIASLQNKCLTEEITRINLTNRSLEAMKTDQPCDQLTTEVTQMSNNNTEAIKHSILNSQIDDCTIEVSQLCKDQSESTRGSAQETNNESHKTKDNNLSTRKTKEIRIINTEDNVSLIRKLDDSHVINRRGCNQKFITTFPFFTIVRVTDNFQNQKNGTTIFD